MPGCWLCGKNGAADPLDKHHIFGGAYRKKSEKCGLTVYLCHNSCHLFGPEAAHNCRETMERLHKYGQMLAMERFGWTVEEFVAAFGKNYLDEADLMPAQAETERSEACPAGQDEQSGLCDDVTISLRKEPGSECFGRKIEASSASAALTGLAVLIREYAKLTGVPVLRVLAVLAASMTAPGIREESEKGDG